MKHIRLICTAWAMVVFGCGQRAEAPTDSTPPPPSIDRLYPTATRAEHRKQTHPPKEDVPPEASPPMKSRSAPPVAPAVLATPDTPATPAKPAAPSAPDGTTIDVSSLPTQRDGDSGPIWRRAADTTKTTNVAIDTGQAQTTVAFDHKQKIPGLKSAPLPGSVVHLHPEHSGVPPAVTQHVPACPPLNAAQQELRSRLVRQGRLAADACLPGNAQGVVQIHEGTDIAKRTLIRPGH